MADAAAITRGVRRWLANQGFESVTELPVSRALRADIVAIGPKGLIWLIEVKSGIADFRSDQKWPGYGEWCDQFSFAVDAGFPAEVLPASAGVLRADAFDAAEERPAETRLVAAARRKALTLKFARLAARRLRAAEDPGATALETDLS